MQLNTILKTVINVVMDLVVWLNFCQRFYSVKKIGLEND